MHAADPADRDPAPVWTVLQGSRWRKQNFQICAPRLTSAKKPLATQIGGYLKRLTNRAW